MRDRFPIAMAFSGNGSSARRAQFRSDTLHAPILFVQTILESLESGRQIGFLPPIDQSTLRICNRLLAQRGPGRD